jgi:hypothetical protein
VHRTVLHLGVGELVRRSLARPALATLVSWIPMLVLAREASSLPLLLLALAGGFLAYVALTVAVRAYDPVDRDLLRSYLRRPAAARGG